MKKNIIIVVLAIIALGLGIFITVDKLTNKPNSEECEVIVEENYGLITFDASKCLNNNLEEQLTGAEITKVYSDGNLSFSFFEKDVVVYNNSNNKSVSLTFDKNVEEIFAGILSSNMGVVYFFLLEDGTLSFMRYSDIYLNDVYEPQIVEGISNIVRLDTFLTSDIKSGASGTITIAYKSDGTFYDLSKYGILDGDGVSR